MSITLTEIIQGGIAGVLVVGTFVLLAMGRPVPTFISGAVLAVISFYVGAKAASSTATTSAAAAASAVQAAASTTSSASVNPSQTGAL